MLTLLQKEAPSIGWKYSFSPTRLNYNEYFISMKNVCNVLINVFIFKCFITECQMFSDFFSSSKRVDSFFVRTKEEQITCYI